MTFSKEIKIIDNKIEKNKAYHDLDRQIANISTLSSGNVCKYEFLISAKILPEKRQLEKAAIITEIEYLPLGSKLKNQTDIAKKI